MKIFKRLDIFILKAYLQLFVAAFMVCLFVFMMQFMWRYVDELIGKGLGLNVIAEFFWYAGLTLVPMSLPLAILLASLISFGNMGEKLELLSMKAAGIPLLRILQPVFIFVIFICIGSFYFQNNIGPEATKNLGALVYSMKQKSPELEIPEGIFYSEIPGYNLYVEKKDKDTGMLYGVMIYTNTGGYEDTQIVLADSARLQSTADKMHLQLTLYNGERFRNMDAQSSNRMQAESPYMRETFSQEIDLIEFDGNFNVLDASAFAGNAATKDLASINRGIDSLSARIDSTAHSIYEAQLGGVMQRTTFQDKKDSIKTTKYAMANKLPFDSIRLSLTPDQEQRAVRTASSKVAQLRAEYEFRAIITESDCHTLRMHYVERHKKFTLAASCLVFFFIGAPLGAIIRKGGLGVPIITSVLIFIFYYIVNVSGEKMAKTGQWEITFGIWLSSMILAPIGAFLTYKANKDSVVFSIEGYRNFFMRVFGIRATRKLNRKEVIINDPNYQTMVTKLADISRDCAAYIEENHLMRIPNYFNIFFHYKDDNAVIEISNRLEAIIDELHNTRDSQIIQLINQYPTLVPDAHTRPFHDERRNIAIGVFLPAGLFFWLRIWRYRLRLKRDLADIQKTSSLITDRINTKILYEQH